MPIQSVNLNAKNWRVIHYTIVFKHKLTCCMHNARLSITLSIIGQNKNTACFYTVLRIFASLETSNFISRRYI